MSNVFVVDTNKRPLNTIHPGEARLLLTRGKAAVLKRYPFTIILKVAIDDPVVAELRIKIDPGSRTTGIAIVNEQSGEIIFAAELHHRGQQIKSSLDDRRSVRRGRRHRRTRYRQPRWQNRCRQMALLPLLQRKGQSPMLARTIVGSCNEQMATAIPAYWQLSFIPMPKRQGFPERDKDGNAS